MSFDPVRGPRLNRALTDRLKNEARRQKAPPGLVRKRFVFGQFIGRVLRPDGNWILLGGNALVARTGGGRFTTDIDLARRTPWPDLDSLRAELTALMQPQDANDPFRFEITKRAIANDVDENDYGALVVDIGVRASIAGTTGPFESFTLDITTSRNTIEPTLIEPPSVITHPDIPGLPRVPVIPIENHLADKLCAMYETHPSGPSQRWRDLADIIRIIDMLRIDARALTTILEREQGRRRMRLPTRMQPPGPLWKENWPIAASQIIDLDPEYHDLPTALAHADQCLGEILAGDRREGIWSQGSWHQ